MEFRINIKKMHLIVILSFIFIVGFVFAQSIGVPNPGHDANQVVIKPGTGGAILLNSWYDLINSRINTLTGDVTALQSANGCPSTMFDAGDFCIDTNRRASATWYDAVNTCRTAGYHLCSGREWVAGCMQQATSGNPGSNWGGPNGEWAGEIEEPWQNNIDSATVYGFGDFSNTNRRCYSTHAGYHIDDARPEYRCCKNLI